jgi:hypothetical protein
MDQHIFDQLDQLERGAREMQPRRQTYDDGAAGYARGIQQAATYDTSYGGDEDFEQYGDENLDPELSYGQLAHGNGNAHCH